MKKFILIFFSILILLGLSSWYLGKKYKSNENSLIIGTSADFAPFAFIQNQKIVGFDIDIAKEVARRLGKKAHFVNRDFDMLLPELQMGHIELIAAGMTSSPERAQQVNFSCTYIDGNPLIAVTLKNKISISSFEDLIGKKIIVNDGYTADLELSKNDKLDLIKLPNITDAFLALNSNRGDVFVTAKNTLNQFLNHYGKDKFNLFILPNTNENCAIAVNKENSELLDKVNKTLKSMIEDGTIEKLKNKWNLND